MPRGWLLLSLAIHQHSLQPAIQPENQTRPSLRNRFFIWRLPGGTPPSLFLCFAWTLLLPNFRPLCCLRLLRPRFFFSFFSLFLPSCFLLPPCELSSFISSLLTYVWRLRFALDDRIGAWKLRRVRHLVFRELPGGVGVAVDLQGHRI